jgi:hypothetical protein
MCPCGGQRRLLRIFEDQRRVVLPVAIERRRPRSWAPTGLAKRGAIPYGDAVIRRVATFVLVLVATAGLVSGASGHALGGSKAKRAVKAAAKRAAVRLDTAELDDVTTVEVRRRRVGPCRRRSEHRVDCRLLMRGVIHDPDLGDLPFRCYARERARLRSNTSHRIRIRSSRRKCRGDLVDLKQDLKVAFKQALRR